MREAGLLPYASLALDFVRNTFLKNSFEYLLENEEGYAARLDRAIGLLAQSRGVRAEEVVPLLGSVVEYTVHYIKEQIRFQRSGRYRQSDFSEVQREVYDNRALMEEMYLPGLYLTQVFWPIHYRLGKEFRRLLLPRLKVGGVYLEAGVGPGHNLLEVLQTWPVSAVAVDISLHSLQFAERILLAAGVEPGRVSFRRLDLAAEFNLRPQASSASLGEVLEHVENPARVLENLSDSLLPGSPVFITTVIDSSAIDHITQFTSVREIDELIEKGGFRVVERNTLSPSDFGNGSINGDPTRIYYGLFIRI